jgi:uncharacterized protein with ATP-grasp and redox domains
MATSLQELRDELDDRQETIDQACEVLEEAYTPEATRADLVAAVSQALDVLSGQGGEEEGEEPGEDED